MTQDENIKSKNIDYSLLSPELKALVALKLAINESLYKKGKITEYMYEKAKEFLNSKEALKYDYMTPSK